MEIKSAPRKRWKELIFGIHIVGQISCFVLVCFCLCFKIQRNFYNMSSKLSPSHSKRFLLKQYSEISGRLKHLFSLTPIDRYSFGKLMFKISIGYDFTLWRDMQNNMIYASPLNTVLEFLCPDIEIQKRHRSAYFVKTILFLQ